MPRQRVQQMERGDILRQRLLTAQYAVTQNPTEANRVAFLQAEAHLSEWIIVGGRNREARNGLYVEARHQQRLARRRERYRQNPTPDNQRRLDQAESNLAVWMRRNSLHPNERDSEARELARAASGSDAEFRARRASTVPGSVEYPIDWNGLDVEARHQQRLARRRERYRQNREDVTAIRRNLNIDRDAPAAPARETRQRTNLLSGRALVDEDRQEYLEALRSSRRPVRVVTDAEFRRQAAAAARQETRVRPLQAMTDVELYHLLSPRHIALNPLWSAGILTIQDGWDVVDHLRSDGYNFLIKSEAFNIGHGTPRSDYCPTVVQFRRHMRPYRNFLAVGSTVPRAIFICALLVKGHARGIVAGVSLESIPESEKIVTNPEIGPGEEE